MSETKTHILSSGFTGKIFNMDRTLPEKCLIKLPHISYVDTLLMGWEYYTFTSLMPLNGNDERHYYNENYDGKPFQNDLICCRAKGHMMIFARGKKAYTYFIEHILNNNDLVMDMTPCYIAIDSFVKNVAQDKNYTLTSISAFYKGIGDSLKSLRLFGEDIAASDLFINNVNSLNIYRCGVKELTQVDEIISLGTDGSLYFKYEHQNMQKISNLFKYLKDSNYLKS